MSKIQDSSVRHKRVSSISHRSITGNKAELQRPGRRPRGVITSSSGGRLLRFNNKGRLPHGIHRVTWQEFTRRFAFNPERQKLLRGLLRAIRLLRRVGCRTIYIGGSFVTPKQFPSDVDVVWESSSMSLERIKRVSPIFFEMTPGSPEQKARFNSEFYPSEGIEGISKMRFLEFFQRDSERGRRRGLVKIDITAI
jgi:predicted nucleotidyltransferase